MELFEKFVKRIDDDFGYDNEKLARDLQKIAEEHQALQLLQTDVIYQLCECGGNERVALDCTSKNCRHPKYNKK